MTTYKEALHDKKVCFLLWSINQISENDYNLTAANTY